MPVLEFLDTTLRDGAQAGGVSYSVEDKIEIAKLLDMLPVVLIEGGNPYAIPKDAEFFATRPTLSRAKLCAFGSTRRKDFKAETDPQLAAVLAAQTETVVIFGKASIRQATDVLSVAPHENLEMIADTVRYLKAKHRRVIFDAEHFFDGYRENPAYAIGALSAAADNGADTVVLCDTNGGSLPDEIGRATKAACTALSVTKIGIHAHNDNGLAVANTLSAVTYGATHIQGTLLGIGERCGNASLATVMPILILREGFNPEDAKRLTSLTHVALSIAEITNVQIPENTPYIGRSAFAHKAGMHADGQIKVSSSFEHLSPERIGNNRRFLLSEMAGRQLVLTKLLPFFPDLNKYSPALRTLTESLKNKEDEGFQYEGAEASFILMAAEVLNKPLVRFSLDSFHVNEEFSSGHMKATASAKISTDGRTAEAVRTSDKGPVNALDLVFRDTLKVFYPSLDEVKLIDYKVRVLNSLDATAAKVRVLITSRCGKTLWTTVGVSEDIIKASAVALVDSYEYILNFGGIV